MNLPVFIAKRYMFSKKSRNVINIISGISVLGVLIGTMALIVILSVFNGLDSLVKSLFSSFDPELKIERIKGKVFTPDEDLLHNLRHHPDIAEYTEVIEENALLEYRKKQQIAKIKGVGDGYSSICGIDSMIIDGDFFLKTQNTYHAVIGYGIADMLSAPAKSMMPLKVWVPKRSQKVFLNPGDAFRTKAVSISGIFSVQPEIDYEYVIVSIEFMRKLLNYQNEVSSIEIKLKEHLSQSEKSRVQNEIQKIAGNQFSVKNRYQQHEFLYKVMQSEKLAIFLILSFIIFVASFNIIASIIMLIIEKKKDISILKSLGATQKTIQQTFLIEGWLISIGGAILGLLAGAFLCWLQMTFGFIKFPGNGIFIVSEYPVEMQWFDFLLVFITVAIIGFFVAWFPVRYVTKRHVLDIS